MSKSREKTRRNASVLQHSRFLVRNSTFRSSLAALVASCCLATCGNAAEFVLRATASPEGSVVRLADVAEIRGVAGQATQELTALPLMPAPAPGTKQFLTTRQIRDMLHAAGVATAGHRFSGASQVAIAGKLPPALLRRVGRLSTSALRNIEQDLRDTILRHLELVAAPDEPWQIELSLEEDQLRQLAEATVPWTIDGGSEPWTGPQVFTVAYQTPGGPNRLEVTAQISLPDPIVVLTAPLARGSVVGRADVQLTRPTAEHSEYLAASAFRSLEDVVGKVARRTLSEGQVLTPSMVEEPTLVRRGQTVRVVAVAAGIRVTTFARARQSGTNGELIYVETLENREPFAAQVSGVREVQVLGR